MPPFQLCSRALRRFRRVRQPSRPPKPATSQSRTVVRPSGGIMLPFSSTATSPPLSVYRTDFSARVRYRSTLRSSVLSTGRRRGGETRGHRALLRSTTMTRLCSVSMMASSPSDEARCVVTGLGASVCNATICHHDASSLFHVVDVDVECPQLSFGRILISTEFKLTLCFTVCCARPIMYSGANLSRLAYALFYSAC